ncbi:MAG TPA: aminoacyl-tRNA hydrolase [bacterium (Candidatus Stahlbacteria)]|nr:aminoacyl-tRNA hydrolase [Candidatus Stahlbacteria bacterium]
MKAVFGIGNHEKQYNNTRHNLGFLVVDKLSEIYDTHFRSDREYLFSKAKIGSEQVLFVKPLTFVNLSGLAAKNVVSDHEIKMEDFLVICDDFNLDFGKIRIRKSGSDGGHKGLASIIYHLGTEEFPRLRIGIGPCIGEATDFVLSEFTQKEKMVLNDIIDKAVNSVSIFIKEGIEKAISVCSS